MYNKDLSYNKMQYKIYIIMNSLLTNEIIRDCYWYSLKFIYRTQTIEYSINRS